MYDNPFRVGSRELAQEWQIAALAYLDEAATFAREGNALAAYVRRRAARRCIVRANRVLCPRPRAYAAGMAKAA